MELHSALRRNLPNGQGGSHLKEGQIYVMLIQKKTTFAVMQQN